MELEQYSWIRKPTRNKITLFLYGIGADSSIFTNDSFNLITLFLYGIGAITNIEYGSIFNYYIIPIWNWSGFTFKPFPTTFDYIIPIWNWSQ